MLTATLENLVLSDKEFREISKIVYDHCGINLHAGKKELVRARLSKLLRTNQLSTFKEYMEFVSADKSGNEFSHLIDSLSTNLTSFFRESQHFDYLTHTFLPSLLKRKQSQRNFKLRAWSSGCSSGEEPYSMAITLLESVKGLGRWDIKILATDISTRILEQAKKGCYEKERIAPVPSLQKNLYLTQNVTKGHMTFEVKRNLRNIIIFRHLNLMQGWPIKGPLDFIFCRNVMIYFDKTTQERLVGRFWDLLDSGGLLFTGHSESLTGINHKFDYIRPTIYKKP